MDIIGSDIDAIADPRWLLEAYAPDLHALIKTAPDPAGLADLSETALTALQEAVRDRYLELVAGAPADRRDRSSATPRPPRATATADTRRGGPRSYLLGQLTHAASHLSWQQ